jgi:hypothetical protein
MFISRVCFRMIAWSLSDSVKPWRMACIVFVGTLKPKNSVGDSLCADVLLEVKII